MNATGVEPLSGGEVELNMGRLDGEWQLTESGTLRRSFSFGDFSQAMEFVNEVAEEAEELDHHPDILIQGV